MPLLMYHQHPIIHNRNKDRPGKADRPKCLDWCFTHIAWETMIDWMIIIPDNAWLAEPAAGLPATGTPIPGLCIKQEITFASQLWDAKQNGRHDTQTYRE